MTNDEDFTPDGECGSNAAARCWNVAADVKEGGDVVSGDLPMPPILQIPL